MSERRRRGCRTRGIWSQQRRSKKHTLYKDQDGRCAACGSPYEKPDLILKHKVHPRDGGSNRLENLHLICHICNTVHKKNGPSGRGAVN